MAAKRRRKTRYILKHEDIIEMKNLRLQDPKKWPYFKLAKLYGCAASTAFKAVNGQYKSEKQIIEDDKQGFNVELERDIRVLESYLGVINKLDLKKAIDLIQHPKTNPETGEPTVDFTGEDKKSLRESAVTALKLILGMQKRRGMKFKMEAENITINQQNIQQNVEIRTEVAKDVLAVVKRFVHPDIMTRILKELREE